jgi:pathogenesis-related protein 1
MPLAQARGLRHNCHAMQAAWCAVVLLTGAALCGACSALDQAASCDVGERRPCVCTGGGQGMQSCLPDGSGWDLCVCDTAPSAEPTSGEPAEMAGMTADHNLVRASVSPAPAVPLPPLAWSATLADVARGWAEHLASNGCEMRHSSNAYGENLFWTSRSGATAADAVDSWESEQSCFVNASFDACTCTCGHYSQMVWRDTRYVGCGRGSCPDGSEIWACNYDPPGNMLGEVPY